MVGGQVRENVSYIERILDAVATERGCEPIDLPPLYDAIDPDALEAVLRQPNSDEADHERRVVFRYAGYRVTVEGTGRVSIDQ